MLLHLPAIVVVLTIFLLGLTTYMVGRGRARYGIKAPATTGNEDFERIFRVQMNTLESVVMFLPTLWLAKEYGDPRIAGAIGLIWLAGRYWYALAYASAANKRGPSFILATAALGALLALGVWGLLRVLIG